MPGGGGAAPVPDGERAARAARVAGGGGAAPVPDGEWAARAARVVVVSRSGCHLCDQAVELVTATLGVTRIAVLDVDGDLGEHSSRQAEWSELVPVILIDGAVHDVIRVNPARLLAALLPPERATGRWRRRR